jgi:ketosteroid isomerase-like protein
MADMQTISQGAEKTYTAYAEAFNAKDMATVDQQMTVPYIMVIDGHPPGMRQTPAELKAQFDGALADMVKRGWVRSDFKIVEVWPLSDNHALLMSDIIRYKADKSTLETGRFIYSMRNTEAGWRITGVTNVAPGMLGPTTTSWTYAATGKKAAVDPHLIVHEIETAYTAYANAFNEHDMATVVTYITAPYVQTIGGNPPGVAHTAEDVRKQFDGSLEYMMKRGWARSDSKIVQIWPMSDDHALLLADIIRYRPDHSILETGRYLYSIRRAGASWQLTGVTDVAPPMEGPGGHPRNFPKS